MLRNSLSPTCLLTKMLSAVRPSVATSCCLFILVACLDTTNGRIDRNSPPDSKITFMGNRPGLSWQAAYDSCADANKKLCVRKNLCKGRALQPFANIRLITYDRWVPILDEYNDWLYIGRNYQMRCKKLSEVNGPPAWDGQNCSAIGKKRATKEMTSFCASSNSFYCCSKSVVPVKNLPSSIAVPVYMRSRELNGVPYYSYSVDEAVAEKDWVDDQAQWRGGGRLPGDLRKFSLMSGYVENQFENPIFFCVRSIITNTRLRTSIHKLSKTWCTYPWTLHFFLYGSFLPNDNSQTINFLVGMMGEGNDAHSRVSRNEDSKFATAFDFYAPPVDKNLEYAEPVNDGCKSKLETLKSSSGVINSPNFPSKFNRGASEKTECNWRIKTDPGNLIRITFKVMKMTGYSAPFPKLQSRSFQGRNNTGYNFDGNCLDDRVEIPGYGTFCGNILPPSFVSISDVVDITFYGKKTSLSISFSLFYEVIVPKDELVKLKVEKDKLRYHTWMSGNETCVKHGKLLCSATQICRFDRRPFYGVEEGDQWVPIINEYNDWVQVGRGNVHTCRRHNQAHGPPEWGTVGNACIGINMSQPCPIREIVYCCSEDATLDRKQSEPIRVQILSTLQNGEVFFKYIRKGIDNINSFGSSGIWSANRKRRGDFTNIQFHSHFLPGISKVVYFCSRKLIPAIGKLKKAYSMFLQPCESKGWELLYYLFSLSSRQKNTFMHHVGIYERWPHHSRAHFKSFPENFQADGGFILYSYTGTGLSSFEDGGDDEEETCTRNTSVIIAPSVLESPGYPSSYKDGMVCRWHIKLEEKDIIEGSRLELKIEELSLEDPVDILSIYEVASSVDLSKSFSDGKVNQPFKSRRDFTGMVGQVTLQTFDSFLLVFVTDNTVSEKGFRVRTEVISNNCGGIITKDGSEIKSPNYPFSYTGGLECNWTFRAPSTAHSIEVKFENFDLAKSPDCIDSVSFVEKGSQPMIFCGGGIVPTMIAFNENLVNMTFKTKFRETLKPVKGGKGFSVRVHFVLDEDKVPTVDPKRQQCGIQTVPFTFGEETSDRIVNGMKAKNGNFPWLVMIGKPGVSCGGSLLNDRWVLTATHCFIFQYLASLGVMFLHEPLSKFRVIAGRYERNKPSPGEQHFNISDIFVHGGFQRYSTKWVENGLTVLAVFPYNDITLARLSTKAIFSPTVSPVCLPTQDAHVGEFCYVAGWGSKESDTINMVSSLNYAKVPILDNSLCNSWKELEGTIKENMLCAGFPNGGPDHCWGDSGGPLLCRGRYGNFYINGIVSWSMRCGGVRTPGIYTRVWRYFDWINAVINET